MLLPQEHTVMVKPTSRWGQMFLLSLVGLGATALGTAWLYRLDEVITVQGVLVPQSGGVEVKSPVNGQLKTVLVKNGEKVKEGEDLIRYDVEGAKYEKETISQQLELERKKLEDQLKNNEQRRITALRNIKLRTKIINRLKPLEESGAISELQILQEDNRLEAQKDELIQLLTIREELINESRLRQSDLEGRLKLVENRLRNEILASPISGIVFNLTPDNDRYVATIAESLMKIVPEGKLGGEVNITNEDIGFIKSGQKVKVRVNSFPYTEYGEINGEIDQIGADALPPTNLNPSYHFPVTLKLEKSKLKTRDNVDIPLQAGMTITTNLKLRDRRLIELLGDLFNDRNESLKRLRQP